MPEPREPIVIYQYLVYSPLVHLLEGVLGIGMFVVGLGYLRHAVRDPQILRHSPFWKRLLLLACVVMFVTYITITYEVDLTPAEFESLADVREVAGEIDEVVLAPILAQAKMMMVTILPIDLLGIVLTAALFAVLSLKDLENLVRRPEDGDEKGSPTDSFGVFGQIALLFLLTGLWHSLIVLWWLIGSLHDYRDIGGWFSIWSEPQGRYSYDMLYHASFAAAHLAYFLLWKRLQGGRWHRQRANLLEWWGLVTYGTLVITVYSTRLFNYVDRLAASASVRVALPLDFLLMPLFVLGSTLVAVLVLRARRRLEAA